MQNNVLVMTANLSSYFFGSIFSMNVTHLCHLLKTMMGRNVRTQEVDVSAGSRLEMPEVLTVYSKRSLSRLSVLCLRKSCCPIFLLHPVRLYTADLQPACWPHEYLIQNTFSSLNSLFSVSTYNK